MKASASFTDANNESPYTTRLEPNHGPQMRSDVAAVWPYSLKKSYGRKKWGGSESHTKPHSVHALRVARAADARAGKATPF